MKFFLSSIIGVVVVAIIVGLFLVGSPSKERQRRFDDYRIQHLQFLQSELLLYWQAKGVLPDRLDQLVDTVRGVTIQNDPETGAPYEFIKKDGVGFALCATFSEPSREQFVGPKYAPVYPYPMGARGPFIENETWEHGPGRVCFDRTIDPDFFPKEQSTDMMKR